MRNIHVQLIDHTRVRNAVLGARTCYNSFDKATPERDRKLLHRLWNVEKHHSLFEHIVFVFDISGISRLCLQELARHRIASYSVKSTRYTLKELRDDPAETLDVVKYCVIPEGPPDFYREILREVLEMMRTNLKMGRSNDTVKYLLPESFRTELVMTINLRSFMNFYELRSSRHAHFEIRHLANKMYVQLPKEVKEIVDGKSQM